MKEGGGEDGREERVEDRKKLKEVPVIMWTGSLGE